MAWFHPTVRLCVLAAWLGSSAEAPRGRIDRTLAAKYFREARALAARDGGRLWGVSLEGPLLFADPATHEVVANQADREGKLTREGNVFVGHLSPGQPVANNALTWAGVRWTMVAWPLPADPHDRAALLMHESWHRIQDRIGFPPTGPANAHLDTPEGRTWLQLEWRALAAALKQDGAGRRAAVEDALVFRQARRDRFPRAAAEERALEMHEGLAEYTGVRLCGLSGTALRDYVRGKLERRPPAMPTFVRSFAYLSGPAYGLLLDETGTAWRKHLKPQDDLGVLLARAFALEPPKAAQQTAEQRAGRYGGDRLRTAEREREEARRRRIAGYRVRLVDGPVLVLPLEKMQFSFDPTAVQPLEGVGTVYSRQVKVTDRWGSLSVGREVLISADFTRARVPAPADPTTRPLKGDGWQLDLADGWEVAPGARKGDAVLRPRKG
jgi:hypothetical protein